MDLTFLREWKGTKHGSGSLKGDIGERQHGRRVDMSNSGYCSLIITGDDLDFSLIEETLKMEASEKRKKGEIVNRVIGAVQNDFLRFDEKTGGKYNPDKTLLSLLDKLMDNEMFLSNLSQKANIFVECYVQSDYAQVDYMLSAEAINKIARLGIGLEIFVFSWGGVKDKKKKKKGKKKC